MKWKTAAFMVLLIFTVSAFAVIPTLPVVAEDISTLDSFDLDGSFVQPCDPIPGGPGPCPKN